MGWKKCPFRSLFKRSLSVCKGGDLIGQTWLVLVFRGPHMRSSSLETLGPKVGTRSCLEFWHLMKKSSRILLIFPLLAASSEHECLQNQFDIN